MLELATEFTCPLGHTTVPLKLDIHKDSGWSGCILYGGKPRKHYGAVEPKVCPKCGIVWVAEAVNGQ